MSPTEGKDDEKLMAYFMGQTNERLMAIETKLIELISFRAEVIAEARAMSRSTSVVVGLACSAVGVVLTIVLKKLGVA
jgi:hypothetical protein